MSDSTQSQVLTKKDFTSDQEVRWCPGCGEYAILSQVHKVFPQLGAIERHTYLFELLSEQKYGEGIRP